MRKALQEEVSYWLLLLMTLAQHSLDSLKGNRRLGLLALGLAVVLWLVITIEKNPPQTGLFPEEVPLQVVNVPGGLHVFGEIGKIRVRVTAPLDRWERMSVEDFVAVADMSGAHEGITEVVPRVGARDGRLRVVTFTPQTVPIRLEASATKAAPVRVEVKGSLPFGYVSQEPVLAQVQVNVIGPQSLVAQVSRVVVTVALDDARVEINRPFPVTPQTNEGYEIKGVRMEPSVVAVRVPVEQQLFYRTLPVKVAIKGAVAPGYAMTNIAVEPGTLTLVGNREGVETVTVIATQEIDVSGATGNVWRMAEMVVPKGTSLVGEQRVLVRIAISPILATRKLWVAPSSSGLLAGYTAEIEEERVELTLAGPLLQLEQANATQVKVVADLTGYGRGSYRVTPTVAVPREVTVVQMSPETLGVTIR